MLTLLSGKTGKNGPNISKLWASDWREPSQRHLSYVLAFRGGTAGCAPEPGARAGTHAETHLLLRVAGLKIRRLACCSGVPREILPTTQVLFEIGCDRQVGFTMTS